jgi:hypothetical protein
MSEDGGDVGKTSFPRLAYRPSEAPAVLGVSDDFFRDHIAGELKWTRVGAVKLVSVEELKSWLRRSATLTLDEADS